MWFRLFLIVSFILLTPILLAQVGAWIVIGGAKYVITGHWADMDDFCWPSTWIMDKIGGF